MAENQDFYQEALKAFDAPIPQPKQEEPAPEPAAVTESAPQEKPKRRFSPWWAVALCAAVCLALVIGFGRDTDHTGRGEHYVYGIMVESGEQYMILSTTTGRWHIDLDGQDAPDPGLAYQARFWVFYNGEPEPANQDGYIKRISATFWQQDKASSFAEDTVGFDLDGDGQQESWWLRYDYGIADLSSRDFPQQLNLTAKDSAGNILYAVCLRAPYAESAVFYDAGGQLSVVLYQEHDTYIALDICLEKGELAVYRDGEMQQLYPMEENTVPTLPPTEPTQGSADSYGIHFALTGVTQPTGIRVLSDSEGQLLKGLLKDLDWTDIRDVIYQPLWHFNFLEGEQMETYDFTRDGDLLLHDGRQAPITPQLREMLMELMGHRMPEASQYVTYQENGNIISVEFYEDGEARLVLSDYLGVEPRTYKGRYATFGDYFLLDLGPGTRNILVLKQRRYSMEYVVSLSAQSLFPDYGHLAFYLIDYGGSLEFAPRDMWGTWSVSPQRQILSVSAAWELRRLLQNCDWQTDVAYTDDEILAYFTLYDGAGGEVTNPTQYFLLTGGRLLREEQQSAVAEINMQYLWQLLEAYFVGQGYMMDTVYTGTNQDGMEIMLELATDGSCSISAQQKNENGSGYRTVEKTCSYVYLGNSLVLLDWEDGPCYMHLDVSGDQLLYDTARSAPNEPLHQTTKLTLRDLNSDAYRIVNLEFSMPEGDADSIITYQRLYVILPEDLARELAMLLNSVQWVEPKQWTGGICMGSFYFSGSTDVPVEVYSGMRLVRGCYEAKLTDSQWDTVCRLMTRSSGIVYATGAASAADASYDLTVSGSQHIFTLEKTQQPNSQCLTGYYSLFDNDVLLCYGFTGDVFVLRKQADGWHLLPGYNGIELFDIPDDIVFAP